jgi:hypothetical protein
MFLDETSKDEQNRQRKRGWARKGKHAVMWVVLVHGRRYSILSALYLDGMIATTVIKGSVM